MKEYYVMLRDFIYGLDFTEHGDDDKIIIYNTAEEVEIEIEDEKGFYEEAEMEYNDDLSVSKVIITDDGYLVAIDDNGSEIVRSEKPYNYTIS